MDVNLVVVREPNPSEVRIYTVHTMKSPGAGFGGDRTHGFFMTLEEAKQCIEENWGDIHECVYKYAVIEDFGPGLYFIPEHEFWYEWSVDKYVSIEKPEEYEGVVCFGM